MLTLEFFSLLIAKTNSLIFSGSDSYLLMFFFKVSSYKNSGFFLVSRIFIVILAVPVALPRAVGSIFYIFRLVCKSMHEFEW